MVIDVFFLHDGSAPVIPMSVGAAMSIAFPMGMSLALGPTVVVPMMAVVAVAVNFMIVMTFAVAAMARPGVASQRQGQSDQYDA